MPRFYPDKSHQDILMPVRFSKQILPGSFEHTLCYLIDNEIELSVFDHWYNNDERGAPAYHPAVLLKIILAAYSRGITSSRKIELLCRENVTFVVLSADSQPHFTTVANFISRMSDVIQPIFRDVLLVCQAQNLIGGELFAIDGCKLPSNASKEWAGTQKELEHKVKKMDRAVRRILKKHRQEDESGDAANPSRRAREEKQIDTLRKTARKIRRFTKDMSDRKGISGNVVKSNITDNDSATMKTSKGNVQGFNGVAAVDALRQVVTAAEAFGQGPENNLLPPLVEQVRENLGEKDTKDSRFVADSGFHSLSTIEQCDQAGIDAYIADGNIRKRDPRFKDRDRHQPKERRRRHYGPESFHYDPKSGECHCPAGKVLWRSSQRERYGHHYVNFEGYLNDCRRCPLQKQCMRNPPQVRGRQVSIKLGESQASEPNRLAQMREKIDSDQGRDIYSQRLGIVEPVFGNINTTKRLNRFSLRGKLKVNAQWLMYCLVHNIEKLQNYSTVGR
jgi:transposase